MVLISNLDGHIVAGSILISVSIWWLANAFWIYSKHLADSSTLTELTVKTRTWFPIRLKWLCAHPVEPIIRAIVTVVALLIDLSVPNKWKLIDKDGELVEAHLLYWAHGVMYGSVTMWSLVEILQFYKLTRLPNCIEHVFASIAFFNIGFLFFFYLHGRSELDKAFHYIILVTAFIIAVVLLLEAWRQSSFLLMLFRATLFGLLGTWVIRTAYSLYVANPWKNNSANRTFVGIVATWHIMAALAIIMTGFVIVTIKTQGIKCRATGERLENGETNEEKASLLNNR